MPNFIAHNGGRFISRGSGRHPARVIDSWELLWVVRGSIGMAVEATEYGLQSGEGLLLAPGVPHRGTQNYPADLSFFWVHFLPGDRAAGKALRQRVGRFAVADPARMAEYFQLFLTVQAAGHDQTALDLLLQLIWHESGKSENAAPPDASSKRAPAAAILAEQIMTLRFREALSTATIAAELRCNPDHLGRLFHHHFGQSLTTRLQQIRLQHAVALLTTTNMYIAEVAAAVGFRDIAYFRRCFQKTFAMPPHAYRRVKSGGHLNTE